MYGTSKKSVPEFGGSTPNLGETHEDGKVNTWEIGNTQNTHLYKGPLQISERNTQRWQEEHMGNRKHKKHTPKDNIKEGQSPSKQLLQKTFQFFAV